MPDEKQPYEPHSANSWWDRLIENWKTEKENALQDGSQAAIDAYNSSTAGHNHPITQEEVDYLELDGVYGDQDVKTGVDTSIPILSDTNAAGKKATEQVDYEIELSKKREAERDAAHEKQKEFLASQPDKPISEASYAYVDLMTGIGRLLGGITDASGGGSPQYTAPDYKMKQVPGYDIEEEKKKEENKRMGLANYMASMGRATPPSGLGDASGRGNTMTGLGNMIKTA